MKKKITIGIFIIIVISILLGICLLAASNNTISTSNTIQDNNVVGANTANNSNNDSSKNIDVVIKDNYFITQLNDIYYNLEDYDGKTIEIEGFPLFGEKYKFVARYGPGCCVGDGLAYLEYVYNEDIELKEIEDWIKIKGTLRVGNDNGTDYIYIEVSSIEKMDTRGKDTVLN